MKMKGIAIAIAAAGMFAAAPVASVQADDAAAGVHCTGINACKGQNDCKTEANACKGQAACKGMGFKVVASADDCTKAGGAVAE